MAMTDGQEQIRTQIWKEEADPADPFVAERCYCRGYDVYGDMLGRASWIEYLHLLLRGERPTPAGVRLLEGLAVGLGNAGPRDLAVRAAMNAGVVGSPAAAVLAAALAVGAGQLGGGHEVFCAMRGFRASDGDIGTWADTPAGEPPPERVDIWLPMEHAAGFDPHATRCGLPVRQLLAHLVECAGADGRWLPWLQANRTELERRAQAALAMSGVAAAALLDLGFEPEAGEMLYLLLRLPGAAAHALEQGHKSYRSYPFFHGQVRRVRPGTDEQE
ncbi:MAG TPA: citryl-CoA lyase [Gammaproteobacteria bacterium]|nr:citryl-CoA lyase [Gammaproteobacteria bacterium]